jgi:DNA ligase (NAD+)
MTQIPACDATRPFFSGATAMASKKKPDTDFSDIDALSEKQAAEEVQSLRETIAHHDYLYYVKNRPEISDAAYDKLFQRLQDLEEAFPGLHSPDSPTVRVGVEPVSKLAKVRHRAPLLSLQATLQPERVESFVETIQARAKQNKVNWCLEPKFDGLSVEVVYEAGRFQSGSTRGNGEVGEDISHNLRTIGAIPLSLRHAARAPDSLSVRGEVFMPRPGFQALNRERVERGEEPFANPRNAAAGLVRQLASRQVAGKPLDVFFYDIVSMQGNPPATHREVLERFTSWGLKTSPLNKSVSSMAQIRNYHRELAERRDRLEYEIDGVVIKVDDRALREALGTRERNPRWALAWKFEPREELTRVEDIVVQVGRTGMLTPVALLQPVDVSGVTVSRATLHNADEVKRKDIRIGDRVRVIRAGDVIPEIMERVREPGRKRASPFAMPTHCPVCGSEVVREGAYYLCTAGLACEAQLIGHIHHYAARDAMDIDQLGEETARQLVERDMVHDLADLYFLGRKDFEQLDGFAERSARQLHEAIHRAAEPRLDRFLYALGIRHVGRRVARLVAEELGDLDSLMKASAARIERVADIGPQIAASVHGFFSESRNRKVLRRMKQAGVKVQPMPRKSGRQPLQGKTFVFTGALRHFTRDEAKDRVEARGGRASSSVSGETDFVVVGKTPGSKLDEAKKRGVKRLSEDEFLEMLDE